MPSSRITTPSVDAIGDLSGLTALLGSVPDPRAKRGQRHELTRLVTTEVAAVIAGARSFVAIGEWAAAHPQAVPMPDGAGAALVPDESTFRRVFALLDATALAVAIGAWLWTRTALVHGRRVIAIDGKTVRGARRRDRAAPHLVAALDHASGTVLGQLAITTKSLLPLRAARSGL